MQREGERGVSTSSVGTVFELGKVRKFWGMVVMAAWQCEHLKPFNYT